VASFIFREGLNKYRVFLDELNGSSEQEILTAYNKRLEELIRRYPEQWAWFHKRWRCSPDGRRLSSKETLAQLQNWAAQAGARMAACAPPKEGVINS
jgi:hypothetical protein